MPVEISLIKSLPLFSSLQDPDLQFVANEAQLRFFEPGRTILTSNSALNALIMIANGQVQASTFNAEGHLTSLELLKEGDSIGWLSIIDGELISKNYIAIKACTAVLIPLALARNLLYSKPGINQQVLLQLTKQIRKAGKERAIQNLPTAYQRIYAYIIHLSNHQTDFNSQNSLPKQHELATIANTSRETVSRALQVLIQRGIVIKDGHKIFIVQREALEKLTQEPLVIDANQRAKKS